MGGRDESVCMRHSHQQNRDGWLLCIMPCSSPWEPSSWTCNNETQKRQGLILTQLLFIFKLNLVAKIPILSLEAVTSITCGVAEPFTQHHPYLGKSFTRSTYGISSIRAWRVQAHLWPRPPSHGAFPTYPWPRKLFQPLKAIRPCPSWSWTLLVGIPAHGPINQPGLGPSPSPGRCLGLGLPGSLGVGWGMDLLEWAQRRAWSGPGTSLLWEKTGRAGAVQPGENSWETL